MELYMIALYKDGVFTGRFAHAGRPCTIRVYYSLEPAKRGLRHIGYHEDNKKIVKITRFEEVTE